MPHLAASRRSHPHLLVLVSTLRSHRTGPLTNYSLPPPRLAFSPRSMTMVESMDCLTPPSHESTLDDLCFARNVFLVYRFFRYFQLAELPLLRGSLVHLLVRSMNDILTCMRL
eukprot:GHVN01085947.1.p1 GENE.GHVN01085947.1~~GHVN01085947.1.p1  ORF type:complete len:113 (-),score=2.92 GHVN01085947.1:350-688(-)